MKNTFTYLILLSLIFSCSEKEEIYIQKKTPKTQVKKEAPSRKQVAATPKTTPINKESALIPPKEEVEPEKTSPLPSPESLALEKKLKTVTNQIALVETKIQNASNAMDQTKVKVKDYINKLNSNSGGGSSYPASIKPMAYPYSGKYYFLTSRTTNEIANLSKYEITNCRNYQKTAHGYFWEQSSKGVTYVSSWGGKKQVRQKERSYKYRSIGKTHRSHLYGHRLVFKTITYSRMNDDFLKKYHPDKYRIRVTEPKILATNEKLIATENRYLAQQKNYEKILAKLKSQEAILKNSL